MWFAARPHQSPPVPSALENRSVVLLAQRYAAEILHDTRWSTRDLPQLSTADYNRVIDAVWDLASGLELEAGQVGAELWKKARYSQDVGQQVSK